ncbi:hypothetical protein D9757_006448 [Collybiopsis confluens]|uniref:Uncharacterized protein n=1 Tax=Collybiopsis confluens TaxID=2823264 RepID=A0A8H5M8D9_9AGAR|nr:hypothetical protein D9757_006448 [Collybiopsis confluens]
MFNSYATISALLVVSLAARIQAIPFAGLTSALPRDVTHIALDERSHEYVAFKRDGSLYGRYSADMADFDIRPRDTPASTCTNLTIDEAKTLGGWNTIVKYADDKWGTGSRKIVVNPKDYPSSGALVCITDQNVKATFTGSPTCQSNKVTTSGQITGTNGTVSIAVAQGFTATASLVVSKAATIGVSDTLSAKINFPEVAEVSESVTLSTSITNTQTSGFDSSHNDVSTVTVVMNAPKGETCNAITSVTTCTLQATGRVQYLASGWVWFNYDDKTHGHYKWSVNIESAVTNADDRSSYAEIKGSVEATTHASYKGKCA